MLLFKLIYYLQMGYVPLQWYRHPRNPCCFNQWSTPDATPLPIPTISLPSRPCPQQGIGRRDISKGEKRKRKGGPKRGKDYIHAP